MKSDTPETDQFKIKFKTTCGEKYWVPIDLAKKIERERNTLNEMLALQTKLVVDLEMRLMNIIQ